MAEYIYTGPASKQLRGNKDAARALEREARAKVGYLFSSMIPGQTFKSGVWSLGNGQRIKVFVWNDVLGKRVIVRLLGVGGEVVETIEFKIEHGLASYPISHQYPIGIYTDTSLTTFNNATTFFGSFTISNCVVTPVIKPTVVDNKYESVIYTDTTPGINPQTFSGLGRLFAQSVLGVGRSLGDVYPAGAGYMYTTVVRGPDQRYWAVFANLTAVLVFSLVVPKELQCLETAIRNAEWNSLELEARQALVLGNLIPGATQFIEIADQTELNDVIMVDGAKNLSGWNWNWSYQLAGEVDEYAPEAVLVTSRWDTEADKVISTVWTLKLDWIDGEPIGILLTSDEREPGVLPKRCIAICNEYDVFGGNASEFANWPRAADIDTGAEQIIAAVYSKTGGQVHIKLRVEAAEQASHSPPIPECPDCTGIDTPIMQIQSGNTEAFALIQGETVITFAGGAIGGYRNFIPVSVVENPTQAAGYTEGLSTVTVGSICYIIFGPVGEIGILQLVDFAYRYTTTPGEDGITNWWWAPGCGPSYYECYDYDFHDVAVLSVDDAGTWKLHALVDGQHYVGDVTQEYVDTNFPMSNEGLIYCYDIIPLKAQLSPNAVSYNGRHILRIGSELVNPSGFSEDSINDYMYWIGVA